MEMATPRATLIGFLGTIQAMIVILFAIFQLLQSNCILDFLGKTPTSVFIKIAYFHEPAYCGPKIGIGEAVPGAAKEAFVLMKRAPFTYNYTYRFNWASVFIGLAWLVASQLLLRTSYRKPWFFTTIITSIMDLAAFINFRKDATATKTLPELMKYIGATAFGTRDVVADTSSVSTLMALVMSKAGVFLFINCVQIVLLLLDRSGDEDNTESGAFAVSCHSLWLSSSARLLRRLPRPNLHFRRDRATTDIEMQTLWQEREVRADPITPGSRSLRAISAKDAWISPRITGNLLSSPQRLIEDECRTMELTFSEKFGTSAEASENRLFGDPDRNEEAQRGESRGARGDVVYFPEMTLDLPQELEVEIAHQRRCLDEFSFDVHSAPNDRLSASLPNLTDGIQDVMTSEQYAVYNDWNEESLQYDYAAWSPEVALNSNLRKQLLPRLYLYCLYYATSYWKKSVTLHREAHVHQQLCGDKYDGIIERVMDVWCSSDLYGINLTSEISK